MWPTKLRLQKLFYLFSYCMCVLKCAALNHLPPRESYFIILRGNLWWRPHRQRKWINRHKWLCNVLITYSKITNFHSTLLKESNNLQVHENDRFSSGYPPLGHGCMLSTARGPPNWLSLDMPLVTYHWWVTVKPWLCNLWLNYYGWATYGCPWLCLQWPLLCSVILLVAIVVYHCIVGHQWLYNSGFL